MNYLSPAFALLICQFFHPLVIADANIDESTVLETIIVDPNGNGNVTTLADAFSRLNAEPNKAMKVLIREGTYRENVTYIKPRSASATVIEGEGNVVISGADIWTDWEEEGDLLYKEWPHDWGLAEYDSNYLIKNDLGRRSEIVQVDGKRLTQVASKPELKAGCFYVDEANDRIWLKLPKGKKQEETVIEVSVRQQLFWARQVNNLVLRNVTFAHAANGAQHGTGRFAVALFGNSEKGEMRDHENVSRNLLIENCSFIGNNSSGMTLSNYEHVRIHKSKFNDNGVAGASPSRMRYVEISECSFNDNNWRIGGYGRFFDWAPAGTKIFETADCLIRDSEFLRNQATGLWLDWQHERFVVRNIKANDNYGAGLYMEGSSGPFHVMDSEFKRNGHMTYHGANHGGVLIAESRNVTLTANVLEHNSHGQLVIRTRTRKNCGGYYSGKRFEGSVQHVNLVRNRLSGTRIEPSEEVRKDWFDGDRMEGGLIIMTTHSDSAFYKDEFLPTLWSEDNVFSHTGTQKGFSNGEDFGFELITLEDWQTQFKKDTQSRWKLEKEN